MDPAQAELEQEMEKTDDFASRTEEEARIKIQVAEETARRVIAEAEQARNTLLRELNETKQESAAAVQKAKQKASDDVAAAKAKLEDEVQRRVRDVEDAYKSIVKAAEDKARASENELEKAQEAAEMTVEEAKEAANEELKAGLAAAEEALAAAEEVAAIEIKGWRDAADAIFSSSLNMSFLDSDQDGLDRDDPLPVHVESLLKDKTVAAKIDKIVAKEKKYEYEIADSNGAPELRHAPSLTHSRSFSSRIGRALIPLL
jgi:dGTP triphosphohydrolase